MATQWDKEGGWQLLSRAYPPKTKLRALGGILIALVLFFVLFYQMWIGVMSPGDAGALTSHFFSVFIFDLSVLILTVIAIFFFCLVALVFKRRSAAFLFARGYAFYGWILIALVPAMWVFLSFIFACSTVGGHISRAGGGLTPLSCHEARNEFGILGPRIPITPDFLLYLIK